jgi:hypothetical protein
MKTSTALLIATLLAGGTAGCAYDGYGYGYGPPGYYGPHSYYDGGYYSGRDHYRGHHRYRYRDHDDGDRWRHHHRRHGGWWKRYR